MIDDIDSNNNIDEYLKFYKEKDDNKFNKENTWLIRLLEQK